MTEARFAEKVSLDFVQPHVEIGPKSPSPFSGGGGGVETRAVEFPSPAGRAFEPDILRQAGKPVPHRG